MNIQERQKKIIEQFSNIDQWEDRYKKLIDMGKKLPPFPEEYRKEENKVKGCQSQVWLFAQKSSDGKVIFFADSDALIVRGLVAILMEIYSNSTPDEIMETSPDFIKALGFYENLSPSRTNGLISMLKQIKLYATALKFL